MSIQRIIYSIFSVSNGIKKKKMSLIESIKTAQTKISFLSEEIGKHNIEKMREFYQRPELTGNDYLIMPESIK